MRFAIKILALATGYMVKSGLNEDDINRQEANAFTTFDEVLEYVQSEHDRQQQDFIWRNERNDMGGEEGESRPTIGIRSAPGRDT